MSTASSKGLQYGLPRLDNVENVEKYRRGGFHPIHLGDSIKNGQYRVLHKLGHGGFSTVWLARDELHNKLVSLKVFTADASHNPKELKLLGYLDKQAKGNPERSNIIASLDDFTINGPNGSHFCYVSKPAGPSLSTISDSPGEVAGTRRLRAPLARKLARQLAEATSLLHGVGIVHGDITPKNVLMKLQGIDQWSTAELYHHIGDPVTDEVSTFSGQKPGQSAPQYLVQPASFSRIESEYISKEVLLIDLGESFFERSPPPNGVGTPVSYCSPELILQGKVSRASDIWALACTIFECRSGFPLFESFIGSSTEVLEEMVRILGMPSESSRALWSQHGVSFTDHVGPDKPSLVEQVGEVGMCDPQAVNPDTQITFSDHHKSIMDPPENRITEDEIIDLVDLLRRTLDYTPEKRLSAQEVADHAWLANRM